MGGVFKIRRKTLANSQLQIGKLGNVTDQLLFGTITGCTISTATVTMSTASFVVPNAVDGDIVALTPGSLPADMFLASASVTAASTITASLYNSGSATAAAVELTMQYILLSAS